MVFVSNPFEPVTLFQQQKRVTRKCRSLQKFLTAQKGGKAVAEPPKRVSAKPIFLVFLRWVSSLLWRDGWIALHYPK
jgi:hypothetical protein